MGLVSKAIMAEYGYQSHKDAEADVTQTLYTVLENWPKDTHTGFLVHFTNRNWKGLSEYSTIDSAELVLGALFAGNYFQVNSKNFMGKWQLLRVTGKYFLGINWQLLLQ